MNVSDKTASLLKISNEKKQKLLGTLNPGIGFEEGSGILRDEMKIKQLKNKLKKEASDKFSDTKKEDFLQDQLRNIQKELGQMEDPKAEMDEIAEQSNRLKCLKKRKVKLKRN
ncbi:MAG: hypothetical protein Ct9H300mP28_36160 [Pseudomonadota bacterium]|nr:MAG: hypothetical protein Ct9H300mP28_36160 [Pseudomonadota bacterium]